MIKAGLVLGMEYGEGALVVDNIKVQYYRAFSGSLGFSWDWIKRSHNSFLR